MQLKFIAMVMGGLILSTSLGAIATKDTPPSSVSTTPSQSTVGHEHLKHMQDIHNYNTIFDDPTSGGSAYEPLYKHKN